MHFIVEIARRTVMPLDLSYPIYMHLTGAKEAQSYKTVFVTKTEPGMWSGALFRVSNFLSR
jgi:hypothetical protein